MLHIALPLGTAPEGVNKACAAHSQPGSTVNRPPQPPPAPTAPMGKPRSTRIAANGAAAMLAQLRADEEVAEDMSGTGRGRGCKAAAALPGELKPQGPLQAAAAQARTVSTIQRAQPQCLGKKAVADCSGCIQSQQLVCTVWQV